MRRALLASLVLVALIFISLPADAKNPIRSDFFDYYPAADGTVLSSRADETNHCGMCHWDFNGGGDRNHYGSRVEFYRDAGNTSEEAFALIELEDSDDDGFDNITEISDTVTYPNTPTFPGLGGEDGAMTVNIPLAEISANLVPTLGVDIDPPVVTVIAPSGGAFDATITTQIEWTATDASTIVGIDLWFSDDNGASWRPLAHGLVNDGIEDWFVPNRPGSSTLIRVTALDAPGNLGSAESAVPFTINPQLGIAPTTFRDMDLPGTQPLEAPELAQPDPNCVLCHGNYDAAVEPWAVWRGSMMSQAARDPIFFACVAVAEQDAPSVLACCGSIAISNSPPPDSEIW